MDTIEISKNINRQAYIYLNRIYLSYMLYIYLNIGINKYGYIPPHINIPRIYCISPIYLYPLPIAINRKKCRDLRFMAMGRGRFHLFSIHRRASRTSASFHFILQKLQINPLQSYFPPIHPNSSPNSLPILNLYIPYHKIHP